MNTGILLRRPGESNYGRYRRFLISNFMLFGRSQSFRKMLITQAEAVLESQGKTIQSIHSWPYLAGLVEDSKVYDMGLKRYHYIESSEIRGLAIKRNCQECSRKGYHTRIFDQPWCLRCPIHDVKLTKTCARCGRDWPSISKMGYNDCRGCGVFISNSELLEAGAFEERESYKVFELTNQIIEPLYKRNTTITLSSSSNQQLCNKSTKFYPSFRCQQLRRRNIDSLIALAGVELAQCDEVVLDFNHGTDRNPSRSEGLITSLGILEHRIKSQLEMDHKLGACLPKALRSLEQCCPICSAWLLISLHARREIGGAQALSREEALWYSLLSGMVGLASEAQFETLVPVPYSELNLFSNSTSSRPSKIDPIPLSFDVSLKIYELQFFDLISTLLSFFCAISEELERQNPTINTLRIKTRALEINESSTPLTDSICVSLESNQQARFFLPNNSLRFEQSLNLSVMKNNVLTGAK